MARRHHVVSKGYQRGFADSDDRILLVDKVTGEARPVSVRDSFVRRGFNLRRDAEGEDEELEDEWARLESGAIPIVRSVAASGNIDKRADLELKVLLAVHFARSFESRRIYEDLFQDHRRRVLENVDAEKLRQAFYQDHGRHPSDEELKAAMQTFLDDWHRSNQFFIERMVEFHNWLLEFLRPKHLQAVRARAGPVEFITGDVPVVRCSNDGRQINVAILDADTIYFPIGRWCAVAVSTKPRGAVLLDRIGVAKCNSLIWRSSQRHIACHPSADWRRCLGQARRA